MSFPAANYFAGGPTSGSGKTALDDLVAATKQLLGASDESELTISGGSITITAGMHTVDTESDAAADTLTNANMTTTPMDGYLVVLRAENAARVVTITHEAGGAGQFSFRDGQDLVLDATTQYVLFWYDSGASPTTLREVARFGFGDEAGLEVNTAVAASPNVLTEGESGKTFSNEGATAQNYHTLPEARAGLRFRFIVQDSDGIRIVVAGTETIQDAANTSTSGGYIEATTVGNVIELLAINASQWFVVSKVGTWTVST